MKFDISAILSVCNFGECEVHLTRKGSEHSEICTEDINYDDCKEINWVFRDRAYQCFEIQYDVENDTVHFFYPEFDFKTQYTLVNILKSQKNWKYIGYAMYDNETEDIVDDGWFDEDETKHDVWMLVFSDSCRQYIESSQHASLFKGEEKDENGEIVEVLDIVISINPEGKKESGSLYFPISFIREELARYKEVYPEYKVMYHDNEEGEPYYLSAVEQDDIDGISILTSWDKQESLDVTSLLELVMKYDDNADVCFVDQEGSIVEMATRTPFFNIGYDNIGEEVIMCYSTMIDED